MSGYHTLRNSSGFPAANTTPPNSSMIALPISHHTTFAMISNPPYCSFFGLFSASSVVMSNDVLLDDAIVLVEVFILIFSAISMTRRMSRSTKRRMVLYNEASESSVSSSSGA